MAKCIVYISCLPMLTVAIHDDEGQSSYENYKDNAKRNVDKLYEKG